MDMCVRRQQKRKVKNKGRVEVKGVCVCRMTERSECINQEQVLTETKSFNF